MIHTMHRPPAWAISPLLIFVACAIAGAQPAPHARVIDAALSFTALQPGQQAVAAVELEIDDGFHAQSHTPSDPTYIQFTIKPDPNSALTLYDPIYPPGQVETYGDLGTLNVYTGRIILFIPFEVKKDAAVGPMTLTGTLRYQCCDSHACYPPARTKFTISTQIVPIGQKIETQKPDLFQTLDPKVFSHLAPATQPSTTQPTTAPTSSSGAGPAGVTIFGFTLADNSYGLWFLAAFVAGIIFNAVPCVLPVLPLKAIGFYEASQHSRGRSIVFGAFFSAGLIASFGVLALLVVVYHKLAWGQLYSSVWFNAALCIILLVMAVGTFGFFTVNLPPAVYSVTPRHDTLLGNFLFGILTAILSTPCTFGLFVLVLTWASRQPAVVGVALVMTVGVGMASPYFLLSAFPEAARRFPRTGPWAELVKQMMAFLLLGSAIYFARRFLQQITGPDGFWWTLFAMIVIAGGYLVVRAFALSPRSRPRLIATSIAALMIVPSLAFTRYAINQPYEWKPYTPEALAEARKSDRVVLVEFTATWCSTCQYLETFVLHDKSVVAAVKQRDVEMLKADLTADDAPGWPLLKQLNPVAAIPFTALYSPASDQPTHLTGIYSADDLRNAINSVH